MIVDTPNTRVFAGPDRTHYGVIWQTRPAAEAF
jgi:hypothetical protein